MHLTRISTVGFSQEIDQGFSHCQSSYRNARGLILLLICVMTVHLVKSRDVGTLGRFLDCLVLTDFSRLGQVEEPTVRMVFLVNTSPFAGREGKFVTSRNIKERLDRELERNLVRITPPPNPQFFTVHIAEVRDRVYSGSFDFK